jgi:hypothetical protein
MHCIFIKITLTLYITIILGIYNIFHIYRNYFNITYNYCIKYLHKIYK